MQKDHRLQSECSWYSALPRLSAISRAFVPTAPMVAYPAELPSPSKDPLNPFPHIGFTVPFSVSEQPAASINCGYDSQGLPIGLPSASASKISIRRTWPFKAR